MERERDPNSSQKDQSFLLSRSPHAKVGEPGIGSVQRDEAAPLLRYSGLPPPSRAPKRGSLRENQTQDKKKKDKSALQQDCLESEEWRTERRASLSPALKYNVRFPHRAAAAAAALCHQPSFSCLTVTSHLTVTSAVCHTVMCCLLKQTIPVNSSDKHDEIWTRI
ncbi:Hypothetical predicted protein [Xyrichtys novacula]|uniref:Uncharacterized protein n=1 Tax=Xyrichtys novacula TaxID=13765 RepID=A0AAV1ENW5_XYRNO|nr:Hypothetical predicted protein [Xyrichtys novacula]